MLRVGEWNRKNTKDGIKWVFKYERDFHEKLDMDSRITYNQTTGVGELWYNVKTNEPINLIKSPIVVGKKLQEAFKTKTYICCIDGKYKTKGKDTFSSTVKFYFNIPNVPECAEQVPSIIQDNMVPHEFFRTDSKTGEVDFYTYSELRDMMSAPELSLIMRLCYDPVKTKKITGKQTVKGGIWSFA